MIIYRSPSSPLMSPHDLDGNKAHRIFKIFNLQKQKYKVTIHFLRIKEIKDGT